MLVQVYDRHGVFLFPSFFEGFGKAFLEAMSRGLVVIASDVGGMHDLIRDGENGFLVAPGDAAALAMRVPAARAEMATVALPPGVTVMSGGSSSDAPSLADCARCILVIRGRGELVPKPAVYGLGQ